MSFEWIIFEQRATRIAMRTAISPAATWNRLLEQSEVAFQKNKSAASDEELIILTSIRLRG